MLKTFIDYGGKTICWNHYFTWSPADFWTPENVEETADSMENKFKLAAEVILSRVNPKLKSFDLTNFWKLDEALMDIYTYNTLSGTSQTHEEI